MAQGMIGVLPPKKPKEETRYRMVKSHSLDHILTCHTDTIESIKTDSKGRIITVVQNSFRGRIIYKVE